MFILHVKKNRFTLLHKATSSSYYKLEREKNSILFVQSKNRVQSIKNPNFLFKKELNFNKQNLLILNYSTLTDLVY